MAVMCWFLRLVIDSLFTDWDPVKYYRRYLSNLIQEKTQLDLFSTAKKAEADKKGQLQKA